MSEDVSLVAPYDGGGWAFQNPEAWFTNLDSLVAAAGTDQVFLVPESEVYRWLAASAQLLAGVAPTVRLQLFSSGATMAVNCSAVITPGTGPHLSFGPIPPIVGPATSIRAQWDGGDAATQIRIRLYGTSVPLGVGFTI